MPNTIILSLDTSTSYGSVALHQGTQLLGFKESKKLKGHTEFINLAIQDLLNLNQITFEKLNAIALINGPGSFTGLRVSGNIARSLSYTLGLPLITFTSLEVMAEIQKSNSAINQNELLCPVLNAFKNQIFFAIYKKNQNEQLTELHKPSVINVSEFHEFVASKSNDKIHFFGEGITAYQTHFQNIFSNQNYKYSTDSVHYPKADTLGTLAHAQLKTGIKSSWYEYVPLYLKASDPEEKLSQKLLETIEVSTKTSTKV